MDTVYVLYVDNYPMRASTNEEKILSLALDYHPSRRIVVGEFNNENGSPIRRYSVKVA